ncbi:MAG: ProQ/FinO family protein [Legionellaceae bacterium]|nr:ProQ/FinO family protein [Legionellaceae bacterium]
MIIIKMTPTSPLDRKKEALQWLTESFPSAFFKKGHLIKPLKIGIYEDILDFYNRLETPPCSKKTLRDSLNYYSSSSAYLRAHKENAPRIDLYGNEVDVITAAQAKYAFEQEERRKIKKQSER